MANEKKKTEEVIPMVDTANKEVLEFSKNEEAEADRIFYEAQGLQADGKTPLEEEKKEELDAEKKPEPEEKEKKEEPEKGMPAKIDKPKEDKPKELEPKDDDDLTKGLTTENADKRISAAQNKMHTSNKTAKDAVEAQNQLQKVNDDLRKIIDENATKTPEKEVDIKPPEIEQTEGEIEKDLEALRTEYPEIAEPMIKMMQRNNAENKSLNDRLDKQEAKDAKREADVETTKQTTHYDAIEEVHPDFMEISQDPLLDEWIEGLGPIERAGAKAIKTGKSGTTKDVIVLLTTFKKANGYKVPGEEVDKTTPDKTDSKLDKAKKHAVPQFNKSKEVNTQDKQIRFTQEQIKDWTEKEWQENEKAVDEAMAEGLVR